VGIVCTDRGQHPERKLGWLFVRSGEARSWPWQRRGDMRAPMPAPLPQFGHAHRFHCGTCGRDVRWQPDTALRVYETLTGNGMRTVDVSLL
jgi:hypothetical protein